MVSLSLFLAAAALARADLHGYIGARRGGRLVVVLVVRGQNPAGEWGSLVVGLVDVVVVVGPADAPLSFVVPHLESAVDLVVHRAALVGAVVGVLTVDVTAASKANNDASLALVSAAAEAAHILG